MCIKTLRAGLFCCLCFIISFNPARAQQDMVSSATINNVSEELEFIDYLINNREFDDALFLLRKADLLKRANSLQTDSINYFIGWVFYNTKQLDSSIVYFNKIGAGSPVYVKSSYYKVFELLYLKKYRDAELAIEKAPAQDSMLGELKLLQISSGYLLQKKYRQFDSVASRFSYTDFACAAEQKNLFAYKEKLQKVKHRSPLVAGVFSAILPGSGKVYAGYKGQAIAAFIPCLVFGAVATENYIKDGPADAKFIAAAGVFSVFYIGNIWGSALSVKTYREQQNNETYTSILLNLHIPLRRVFN